MEVRLISLLLENFQGVKHYSLSFAGKNARIYVDNFISGIRDEARKKAASNKEELRKKHFAMFPALPDNLAEYCEDNIFDHTFIFISKIDGNGKRKSSRSRYSSFAAARYI